MSPKSRSKGAPGACPACEASSVQRAPHSLELEPTRLEREPLHAPDCPRHAKAQLGGLLRRLFLVSVPALSVPACTECELAPDTSVGLDNGTVGQAELPLEIPRDRAA